MKARSGMFGKILGSHSLLHYSSLLAVDEHEQVYSCLTVAFSLDSFNKYNLELQNASNAALIVTFRISHGSEEDG